MSSLRSRRRFPHLVRRDPLRVVSGEPLLFHSLMAALNPDSLIWNGILGNWGWCSLIFVADDQLVAIEPLD